MLCVIPFYTPLNKEREQEIKKVLDLNIKNNFIKKIVLMIDDNTFKNEKIPHPKISTSYYNKRPTYQDWILECKKYKDQNEFLLCMNSDIELEEDFSKKILKEFNNEKEILMISRYEKNDDLEVNLRTNPHWTQDVWVIKSEDLDNIDKNHIDDLRIPFGYPRCDNKLAYEFWLRNWKIINPCKRIKTIHHQKDLNRTYSKKDKTILGGCAFVHPSPKEAISSEIEVDIFSLSNKKIKSLKINQYLTKDIEDTEKSDIKLKEDTNIDLNRFSIKQFEDNKIKLKDNMFPFKSYEGNSLREVLENNIFAIYLNIKKIVSLYESKKNHDDLFWQYPAETEREAFIRHRDKNKLITKEDEVINLYLPIPWATIIDKNIKIESKSLKIIFKFIDGITSLLEKNGFKIRIHTVCQHIHYLRLTELFEKFKITDLYISHFIDEKKFINKIKLYPWSLYAPNVEISERKIGLSKIPIEKRKYLGSFIGAYMEHYIDKSRLDLANISSRKIFIKIKDSWHFNKDVYIFQKNNKTPDSKHINNQKTSVKEYNQILSDSIFSLCPTGAGYNTLRFWESLALGIIPVLINNNKQIPFLDKFQEFRARQGEKVEDFLIKITSNDLNNLENKLNSISIDELKNISKLCIEFYDFSKKVLISDLYKKSFKVFYKWPSKSFPFRLYFDHPNLRIFIIENIIHNWDWLSVCNKNINKNDIFLVYLGWDHDENLVKNSSDLFEELNLNKNQFYIMCNSYQEIKNFEKYGFKGDLINHNCWLDWNGPMKILNIEKKFNAIYIARRSAFKRHMLAAKVGNLALIAGNNHGKDISPIPDHIYLNNKLLKPDEVCQKINQSYCGLILSEKEGACFSSSEYLLCGIPVVSTKSSGGRDIWYDNYNSIIVEPNEDRIKEAVDVFLKEPRDPSKIRANHINLALSQRKKFINVLKLFFDKFNVKDINPEEYFNENYFHKLRGGAKIDDVIKLFNN